MYFGIRLFIALAATLATLTANPQSPPPSALINQESEETVEAARAASPHTSESTYAYFREEAEAFLDEATQRIWDPNAPREPSPRTAWGDPDLSGYWLNVAYVPLERPVELAEQPLYTEEEAIAAFVRWATQDASVDPATVHYDWTEFGMDNWQSPIRPNLRTSLIVDPSNGRVPPLTPEGQVPARTAGAPAYARIQGFVRALHTGQPGPAAGAVSAEYRPVPDRADARGGDSRHPGQQRRAHPALEGLAPRSAVRAKLGLGTHGPAGRATRWSLKRRISTMAANGTAPRAISTWRNA